MFYGLGNCTPSSVIRRTEPGRHTLKRPSQLGESLWSPSRFRICRRTRSPTWSSSVRALLTVGECTEPDAPP
jgi:hypothetical protein